MSHRNEPARERRRMQLKQRGSLSSLPLNDFKKRRLTLENHFGWIAMQKCQVGDGRIPKYPQVVQYHEKPHVEGPDYQKVTYVLYLNEKADALGKKEKEVQTSPRTVTTAGDVKFPQEPPIKHRVIEEEDEYKELLLKEEKPPKEEKKKKEKKKEEKKKEEKKVEKPRDKSPSGKKKLIKEFYKRDRSASGDRIFRPIDDDRNQMEENPVVVENYTTDYVPPGNKKPKTEKGRSKPKSWQLRAEAGSDVEDQVVDYEGYERVQRWEMSTKEVRWEPTKPEYLYVPKRRGTTWLRDC
ncbi:uncharacterized protein LOC129004471 [Macrosteles quadrilineatus]|uniref:uncharacterized protein LOC129004471 n=1 Tax=Macrosteles quadrilineatus TaxID=74068 RepID=UPI0023E0CD58|nr:uncharacterized protein LOC129004471 [Macrosteles quadrilineatus]